MSWSALVNNVRMVSTNKSHILRTEKKYCFYWNPPWLLSKQSWNDNYKLCFYRVFFYLNLFLLGILAGPLGGWSTQSLASWSSFLFPPSSYLIGGATRQVWLQTLQSPQGVIIQFSGHHSVTSTPSLEVSLVMQLLLSSSAFKYAFHSYLSQINICRYKYTEIIPKTFPLLKPTKEHNTKNKDLIERF